MIAALRYISVAGFPESRRSIEWEYGLSEFPESWTQYFCCPTLREFRFGVIHVNTRLQVYLEWRTRDRWVFRNLACLHHRRLLEFGRRFGKGLHTVFYCTYFTNFIPEKITIGKSTVLKNSILVGLQGSGILKSVRFMLPHKFVRNLAERGGWVSPIDEWTTCIVHKYLSISSSGRSLLQLMSNVLAIWNECNEASVEVKHCYNGSSLRDSTYLGQSTPVTVR